MVKGLVKWIFILSILLFLTAMIAPSFINWNSHKDVLLSQITRYIKDDISIEVAGDVDFNMLPRPALSLNNVDIIDSNKKQKLAHLASVSAIIKFRPLLEGKVEFYSLDLVKPVLEFKLDAKGRVNNLNIFKESSTKNISSSAHLIQLNKINVKEAAISYENPYKKNIYKVSNVNLEVFADNITGPYLIEGDAHFNKADLDIKIKTGKYVKGSPIALNFNALPKKTDSNFPKVKYSGVLDVDNELALQGELYIEDGKLYSLLIGDSLKNITFLHDKIKLKALLNANKKLVEIVNISAKSDKSVSYTGDVSIDISQKKQNIINADIKAKNFTVTNRVLNGFIYPPKTFVGNINLEGENIVLAGENISRANLKVSFLPNLWDVKVANLYMRGGSYLTLSTKFAPKVDNIYNVNLETSDLKSFLTNLPVSDKNIFNKFAENELFKKIKAKGRVKITDDVIDISNLTSELAGLKFKGDLQLDRKANRNNIKASVIFDELDIVKRKTELENIRDLLIKTKSEINLHAKNVKYNDVTLSKLSTKLASNNGNIKIEDIKTTLANGDVLVASGKIDGFKSSIATIELDVNAQAKTPEKLAKFFGLKIPMLKSLKHSSNIKGKLSGSLKKTNFELEGKVKGGAVSIKGSSSDKGKNYIADIKINTSNNVKALLSSLSIPAKSLISKNGKLELSGKIKGNDRAYKITNMQGKIGDVSFAGSVSKLKTTKAKIVLDYLNVDNLIKSDISKHLDKNTEIELSVNKNSWGGTFAANIKSNKDGSASVKGSLKNTDLNAIIRNSGVANNLYLSKGDLEFDLVRNSKKLKGDVKIITKNLEIPQLNYNEIGMLLNAYDEIPKDLEGALKIELRKGKITFPNITLDAFVDGNKVGLNKALDHKMSFGSVQISEAVADLHNKDYKTVVKFDIVEPKRIPKFKIEYSKGKEKLVGLDELKTFIEKNNPPPLQMFSEIGDAPTAVHASDPILEVEPVKPLDPTPTPELEAIGGILDRLDE